jgi:hypothetical protein
MAATIAESSGVDAESTWVVHAVCARAAPNGKVLSNIAQPAHGTKSM